MSDVSDAWPRGRSRDGGIDRVPLPVETGGALWMCGKHAIGPDPQRVIDSLVVDLVVCLTERFELAERYPEYTAWLDAAIVAAPASAIWFPIPDLHAPSLDRVVVLVEQIRTHLDGGRSVLVHCAAGFGRTGTIVACVLVSTGMTADAALEVVAAHRPMAGPEGRDQLALVLSVEARFAR